MNNPWNQFTDPTNAMRMWTDAFNAMMAPWIMMMQAGWGMNPSAKGSSPGYSNMMNPWAGMMPGMRGNAGMGGNAYGGGLANPWNVAPPSEVEPGWQIHDEPGAGHEGYDYDEYAHEGYGYEEVPDDEPARDDAERGLGVGLELGLGRATVSVHLDSGWSGGGLELGELRTVDGVELKIADDALALDGGRVAVRLSVSDHQAAGYYSASIYAAGSGQPVGRIDVRVDARVDARGAQD